MKDHIIPGRARRELSYAEDRFSLSLSSFRRSSSLFDTVCRSCNPLWVTPFATDLPSMFDTCSSGEIQHLLNDSHIPGKKAMSDNTVTMGDDIFLRDASAGHLYRVFLLLFIFPIFFILFFIFIILTFTVIWLLPSYDICRKQNYIGFKIFHGHICMVNCEANGVNWFVEPTENTCFKWY